MLYDRPYMRASFTPPGDRPWFHWLLASIVGAFIVQNLIEVWIGSSITRYFYLSTESLLNLRLWTVFTYGFLHGNLLHFFINTLFLFIMGRSLVHQMGQLQTARLTATAILIGGLFWSLIYVAAPGANAVIGASAGLCGLATYYCLANANSQITFLLFFFLPVTLSTRLALWLIVGGNGLGFAFEELAGLLHGRSMGTSGVSYSAHLGGCLGGWLFLRHQTGRLRLPQFPTFGQRGVSIEQPRWAKRNHPAGAQRVNKRVSKRPAPDINRILDKINEQGFASLTEAERRILEKESATRKT